MSPQRYLFRRQRHWYQSPLQVFVLLGLIIGGLSVTQGLRREEIKPLFLPTPTPTRIPRSYALEAETHFQAGNLDAAIASYQQAIEIDPQNGRLHAELARILTYSTEAQTTDAEKQERYRLALQYARQSVELSPEDSTAFAVLAFTLDWYSGYTTYILKDQAAGDALLTEAEQTIAKATQLDETNVLAQVYRAEIMIDQQRWDLAESALRTALERDPNLWEVYRVNALYLENQARYLDSIKEYERAVALAPNMTFLYIKLGMAWRSRGLSAWRDETLMRQYYTTAIDYFDQAARLNEQLGIEDPIPYLGIGRAYAQIGEFYSASRNMNKALQLNPASQDVYAQLGMVYRSARNYEDAILALGCAVQGCSKEVTCELRKCNPEVDPPIELKALPLTANTVVYYFTYASLKAAMYQPSNKETINYCRDAMAVINQVRSSEFGSEQTIIGILNESASICQSAASQQAAAAPTPILTATASGPARQTSTPTPTPTPTPAP